jgi:L-threonylcarbamoyladenylate synthase
MKYRHYAPKGQLTLVEGDRDKVIAKINELVKEKEEEGHKVGVIGTDETLDSYHADILRSIGSRQKPETVAANLYRILREFDDLECDYMYSESFFEQGLGNAIMNRMLKAAGYHLITL